MLIEESTDSVEKYREPEGLLQKQIVRHGGRWRDIGKRLSGSLIGVLANH